MMSTSKFVCLKCNLYNFGNATLLGCLSEEILQVKYTKLEHIKEYAHTSYYAKETYQLNSRKSCTCKVYTSDCGHMH